MPADDFQVRSKPLHHSSSPSMDYFYSAIFPLFHFQSQTTIIIIIIILLHKRTCQNKNNIK